MFKPNNRQTVEEPGHTPTIQLYIQDFITASRQWPVMLCSCWPMGHDSLTIP